ncbi:MAG: glycosyltransferase family 39 protein [Candidatus Omnitrophica bacterium]|nr:glycosyltransferase family 39 protein [Candidatus Omnitrophota bacterium]
MKRIKTDWLYGLPTYGNALALALFTVFICIFPNYLNGEMNLYQYGLFLPGVDAVLKGLVPYRDFFHLYGPLTLYLPALVMKFFGVNIPTLSLYFYISNVLTFLLCVLIAKDVFKTKFVYALCMVVLIARTFPQGIFTCADGLGYVFGLWIVYSAVKYIQKQKKGWLLSAGILTACAFLSNWEIGVCAFVGIVLGLCFAYMFKIISRELFREHFDVFGRGILFIFLPYVFYLILTGSLVAYLNSLGTVILGAAKVMAPGTYPKTALEFIAWLIPGNPHFKFLTPAYLYLAFSIFCYQEFKNNRVTKDHAILVTLAGYGATLFVLALGHKEGAGFLMALQPEKIILFYLLERFFVFFLSDFKHALCPEKTILNQPADLPLKTSKSRRETTPDLFGTVEPAKQEVPLCLRKMVIPVLMFLFIGSSLGFALIRYYKKFPMTKILLGQQICLKAAPTVERPLRILRAQGMVVPAVQAEDLESLTAMMQKFISDKDRIFMYPEEGALYFLAQRSVYGRFPMATLSWLNDRWHQQLMTDLKENPPQYIVLPKVFSAKYNDVYFLNDNNRIKFNDMLWFVAQNYVMKATTSKSVIYQRKSLDGKKPKQNISTHPVRRARPASSGGHARRSKSPRKGQ